MYRGKHEKPAHGMKKYKKSGILLASLVLILVLAVGTTVAFLIDKTDPVTNIFTPSHVDIEILETLDGNTKSDVYFQNNSDIPVFVRAKVIVNWVDAYGNIASSVDESKYFWKCSEAAENNVFAVKNDWVPLNGYYYYKAPVAVGATTGNLFDTITMTCPAENPAYTLQVEILCEAIQAQPENAVQDAWGVSISDGKVTAVSGS